MTEDRCTITDDDGARCVEPLGHGGMHHATSGTPPYLFHRFWAILRTQPPEKPLPPLPDSHSPQEPDQRQEVDG